MNLFNSNHLKLMNPWPCATRWLLAHAITVDECNKSGEDKNDSDEIQNVIENIYL